MRSEPETLTRGEWWLLETAVDCKYPLPFLATPEPDLTLALNYKGHGLSRNDLFTAFRSLRDRGDIVFNKLSSDQPITLSDEELFANLTPVGPDLRATAPYYGLTPAGGARWEANAEADWTRFYTDAGSNYSGRVRESQRVLIAGSPARLRELLDYQTGLWHEVVAGSVIEEVVRPWVATYWKTLPVGYRARFRVKPFDIRSTPRAPEWKATSRALLAWYRFTWHGGWGGLEPAPGAGPVIRT